MDKSKIVQEIHRFMVRDLQASMMLKKNFLLGLFQFYQISCTTPKNCAPLIPTKFSHAPPGRQTPRGDFLMTFSRFAHLAALTFPS